MNNDNTLTAVSAAFPIVGIGASAGGLTALEQFLSHVPPQCGVCDLNSPGLAADAMEVLRTLVFRETDVPAAAACWFRVRIMPYRTQDNRIDGLVITFSDISASKKLELELRQVQASLKALTALQGAQDSGHVLP